MPATACILRKHLHAAFVQAAVAIQQTGSLDRNLYVSVLEAGKSAMGMSADLVSGEGPFPGCLLTVALRSLLPRAPIPPSAPQHLPKPRLHMPSPWGLGFHHGNSGRTFSP